MSLANGLDVSWSSDSGANLHALIRGRVYVHRWLNVSLETDVFCFVLI